MNDLKIKYKFNLFLVITALYLLASKLFFNESASVNGGFEASGAAVKVAILSIFYILSILAVQLRSLFLIPKFSYIIVAYLYYIYAIMSAIYSPLTLVTSFKAFMGLGFVYVACISYRLLRNLEFEYIAKFLWVVYIASFGGSLLFVLKYGDFNITSGVASGYSAAIGMLLVLYYLIVFNEVTTVVTKIKLLALIFIISCLSLYMKSFSAVIGFYFVLLMHWYLTGKIIRVFSCLLLTVFLFGSVVVFLEANPTMLILNKPAGAYLIGSGRFDMYAACIDLFQNKFSIIDKTFGIGYMAEREYLKFYTELTWSTDPHNSLAVSVLGLGYIGGGLYSLFVLLPYFKLMSIKKKNISKQFHFGICAHTMGVVYGITSSQYIGSASILFFVVTACVMVGLEKPIK